jgi:hypothetical protein
VFAKEFDDFRNFSLQFVNTDILVLVLSLTPTNQTFDIARVCKRWNKIVNTNAQFWTQRVIRYWKNRERMVLQEELPKFCEMVDLMVSNLDLFVNTQANFMKLPDCMHYLFREKPRSGGDFVCFRKNGGDLMNLTIWSRDGTKVSQVLLSKKIIRFYECSKFSFSMIGASHNFCFDNSKPIR